MSLNDSVISGKCWRCARLKTQLRDRDEKLEAVKKLRRRHKHCAPRSHCTFSAELDRILKGGE